MYDAETSFYELERERQEDAWATADYYREAFGDTGDHFEDDPVDVFELVKGDRVVTFALYELGVSISGFGRPSTWHPDFESARVVWRGLVADGYLRREGC